MDDHEEGLKRLVHAWDPQRRNNVCGAPGQIGSTKHARSVTCAACLARLATLEAEAEAAAVT